MTPTDRIVALTRDLVLIPSTEHLPLERERCLTFCQQHLDRLPGVTVRRLESSGFGSLLALPTGIVHPQVLLTAHVDVIDHPHREVFRSEIRDGRIYGPGAGDMKGQCAILMELFVDLHTRYPGLSLGLALTSDEERGGENGIRFLFDEVGLRRGVAILPDGGSMNEVTVREKGILHLRLRAEGHAGHAARPWLGPNALRELMSAVLRVTKGIEALGAEAPQGEHEAADQGADAEPHGPGGLDV